MGFGAVSMPLVSGVLGAALFLILLWTAWVSRAEGEPQAAVRLRLAAFIAPVPFLIPLFLPEETGVWLASVLVGLAVVPPLSFLVPFPGPKLQALGQPVPGVDERNIMFSRATLVPGTDRFEEYYRSRPRNRELDDKFRKEPGLLAPGSAHFHREGFAAADAAFWTIEMLRPFVEGDGADSKEGDGADSKEGDGADSKEGDGADSKEGDGAGSKEGDGADSKEGDGAGSKEGDGADSKEGDIPYPNGETGTPTSVRGPKLGGERASPDAGEMLTRDPEAMTRFLKTWTLKMGAHSVGVTDVKDYHLYSHVGRGPDYGETVDLDHTHALALTVEMDKEMVDRAPRSPTAMESALQYLRCGVMAVQLADLIRRLGYRARAHVDGNYRVICPLVARDAGLGEFGRMGLLMTPRLGPRVRIAVVTTDLPLEADALSPELTTIDFCLKCKKCADSCPSRAIPFEGPQADENGVLRWRIDAEACFTLWGRLGTDCARCMAVCPYSHPDNTMHSLVRWGIRNNGLFRKGSLWMDDLVYGRRPPPKGELEWMDVPESKGEIPRSHS